jgi:hypothetical protein
VTDDLEQTTITPTETLVPAAGGAPLSETYEPAADAAPATTVLAPGATVTGNRRWAIAAGVVGVLVVASALAFSAFTGRANATVLGYVPSDSIMYGEFRMDLPGDQRQAVGSFLSKFPGFSDQSTIETKIDEVLDRLVGGATNGDQAFSSDIKPWFGGEVAFSVGALPDPVTLESPEASMDDARFLALLSVKDEEAALDWLDGVLLPSNGSGGETEGYEGVTLNLFPFGDGVAGQGNYVVLDGKVALIGDKASVRAAIDTKGAGEFASSAEFKSALEASSGDHVGFMFVALRPILEWSSQVGGAAMPGLDSQALTGLVPDWTAFAVRVEGDALRMETLSPKPEGDTVASRTSTIAEHVPSSAIALSVSNDYGKGILATINTYRDEPTLKEFVDGFDQAIGVLGGPDAALGWIGDFGIAVTRTDGGAEGGLVITPTDRAAAENLFTSLRTIISLGGGEMGVTLREEDHAGTTITIVDLGDLSELAGLAGTVGGVSPEMFGTEVPEGRVELAYAVTDDVVVIGSGPGFVRSVLDTTPDTSLARNDRYEALISKAGGGTGSGFADITAIRGMIEGAMANADAAERAEYETNIKPFLAPIDAVIGSSSTTGDISRSTVIVTVK